MSAAPQRATKKRADAPVYLRLKVLTDPDTGGKVRAFVARYAEDAAILRERNYAVGSEVRAVIRAPRNPAFHRKAHVLGSIVVANIEGFESLDAHAAVKRLQTESGACCDVSTMTIPELGVVSIKSPQSISFDSMDQEQFESLMTAIYRHIVREYWPTMTEEQIGDMVELELAKGGV